MGPLLLPLPSPHPYFLASPLLPLSVDAYRMQSLESKKDTCGEMAAWKTHSVFVLTSEYDLRIHEDRTARF